MLISYTLSQTSIILRVKIRSASTGNGITGLAYTTSGLTIAAIADVEAATTAYTSAGSTIQSIATLGTYAAPSASDCRFGKVDDTNHPGLVEIQLANTRYSVSNAKYLWVTVSGISGQLECDAIIPLTSVNPYDGVHGGMSALPNTACTTNASLLTSGTGTDQLSVSSGKTLLQATQTGVTIPTVTNLTNAPTNGDLTAAMKTSVQTASAAAITASGLAAIIGTAPVDSNYGTLFEAIAENSGYLGYPAALTVTGPATLDGTDVTGTYYVQQSAQSSQGAPYYQGPNSVIWPTGSGGWEFSLGINDGSGNYFANESGPPWVGSWNGVGTYTGSPTVTVPAASANVTQWLGQTAKADANNLPKTAAYDPGTANDAGTAAIASAALATAANLATASGYASTAATAATSAASSAASAATSAATAATNTASILAEVTFVRGGTAQAGSATTITLDSGASATNSAYVGNEIQVGVDTRTITAYVGSTKVATVDSDWTTNPTSGTPFKIFAGDNTGGGGGGGPTLDQIAAAILETPGQPIATNEAGAVTIANFPTVTLSVQQTLASTGEIRPGATLFVYLGRTPAPWVWSGSYTFLGTPKVTLWTAGAFPADGAGDAALAGFPIDGVLSGGGATATFTPAAGLFTALRIYRGTLDDDQGGGVVVAVAAFNVRVDDLGPVP